MLLSLVITVVATTVGLFLLFTTPKKVAENGENEDQKTHDEVKSFWQYFGLVDDTPNLIRAVVAGNEDKGPIVGYLTDGSSKFDPILKRLVPIAPGEDPYADENPLEKILRTKFGKRIYGWPLISNIRPLQIDRVVKAKTTTQKLKLADQLSASSVKRYGLKEKIFRPTYHDDLDTTDGTRFSVTSYATLRVFNPEPAFTIYSDDLLPNISEIISGLISSKVLPYDWEHYKETRREGIHLDELTALNLKLEPLGVEITQLTMSDPEVNDDMQAALEAEKKAERAAAAKIREGTGQRYFDIQIAEGQSVAIERLAKAKAARISELVAFYERKGILVEKAVEMANDLVAREFTAESIAKLQGTYAPGLGAGVIGLGGEKK